MRRHAGRDGTEHPWQWRALTANRPVLESPSVRAIAETHGQTVQQVIFRFALEVGMLPLTGTTSPDHMAEDLGIYGFELEREQLETIAKVGKR